MSSDEQPLQVTVSRSEAFWTWCRVAALSFGGPAGQIAVMHRIIVEEKRWLSEERFLHALNYCMLLPGPEAQQLATYIGWLMHRAPGAIMAGTLFVLPGFVSILILSLVYMLFQQTLLVEGLFFGLKPAVLAIVLSAVVRIGRRVLKNRVLVLIAVAAFIAIFLFNVPFPFLVLSAGLLGWVGTYFVPELFAVPIRHQSKATATSMPPALAIQLHSVEPSMSRSLRICAIFLALWAIPLGILAWQFGTSSVYVQEGLFFSKAAVVTFGGAYSVLSYVAQQAVHRFGWLQPEDMLNGLGMAETTPGPLIQVVQFVGFVGAYRNPGSLNPIVAGLLGSVVTTWVTYVPCFFWILLGAPYVERLRHNDRLNATLTAITAAVVGVILNLAVWFAMHTLFGRVHTTSWFGLHLTIPDFMTINLFSGIIAIVAIAMTFVWNKGLAATLGLSAALGLLCYWLQVVTSS